MIWNILKVVFLLGLAYMLYKMARIYRRQREFELQGVIFMKFAIVLDTYRIIKYAVKFPHDLVFIRMI